MGLIVSAVISVLCGILTVLILQAWPPRYRWSRDIAWAIGVPSGSPVYRVCFMRPGRRLIWKHRRGPIDVSFKARVAVRGLTTAGLEHIIEIPVIREWRPMLGRSVYVYVLPQLCKYSDLRYFPDEIKQKRLAGNLRLEDLLGIRGSAVLRIYAFAYRPYTGTRWMRRGAYTLESVKPGRLKGLKLEVLPNNQPPEVEDLNVEHPPSSGAVRNYNMRTAPKVALTFGSFSVEVHGRLRHH